MTPTPDQTNHAKLGADRLMDIAQLLRDCVFPGALAVRVAASIQWLEQSAQAMRTTAEGDEKKAKAEEKRKKKSLKRSKLTVALEVANGEAPKEG